MFTAALIVATIVLYSTAGADDSSLKIILLSREEHSNTVQIKCEETFANVSTATTNDIGLFRFNSTGTPVTDLYDTYDFTDGILTFTIRQDTEGCYYCSRNHPVTECTGGRLILSRPTAMVVDNFYLGRVGETVVIKSGIGEGSLASHYTASYAANYTKGTKIINDNISRGTDFSLTISPLKLSDIGTYKPSVRIDIGNGEHYKVQDLPQIKLQVYQPVEIEVPPRPLVGREGTDPVSLTCRATGGPSLNLSWLKDGTNITKNTPSNYRINNRPTNEGTMINSTLTIYKPKYTDSGRYVCVVSVLDGQERNDFRADNQSNLVILESDFSLNIVITEHKQVQLWVVLRRPISQYAVTAMVYFSLPSDSGLQPEAVETHSIVANTTIMVFQLEDHEVPEKFRETDFIVQVALRVGSTQSGMVPNSLESASTANLNQPTETVCDDQKAKIVAAIAISCTLGVITLLLSVTVIVFIVQCNKTRRLKSIDPQARENDQNRSYKLNDEICEMQRNPNLGSACKKIIKTKKKELNKINGRIRVDGKDDQEEKK